jgi:hypothetical protein
MRKRVGFEGEVLVGGQVVNPEALGTGLGAALRHSKKQLQQVPSSTVFESSNQLKLSF